MPIFKKLFSTAEFKGLLLFFREIFQNPGAVGALVPSSKRLAKNLADHAMHTTPGLVVELGAGTGVVTRALLKQGIPEENIIVIERAKSLVKHLQTLYPKINIIHGDAINLHSLLGDKVDQIATIVSSLPLRSLPEPTVKAIIAEIERTLKYNALFIQYTYSFGPAMPHLLSKLKLVRSKRIWTNIPPARIEVFQLNTTH